MNDTTAERLEMRWLPVVDAAGRTRMEATWVAVPAAAAAAEPAVDARRLRRSHPAGPTVGRPSAPRSALRLLWRISGHESGIEADHGPLWVIES